MRWTSLRIGLQVRTRIGVGRVWEVYPSFRKVAVLFDDCAWPRFLDEDEIFPTTAIKQR